MRPYGEGKIGVVWHTTRSGKSITMAIYAGILRQLPELRNHTIVVQADRFDLNRQIQTQEITSSAESLTEPSPPPLCYSAARSAS